MSQLTFSQSGGPITDQTYSDLDRLLNTYVNACYVLVTKKMTNDFSSLFYQLTAENGSEYSFQTMHSDLVLVPLSKDGDGNLVYASPPPGFKVTIPMYLRRLGISCTREYVETDGYGVAMQMLGGIPFAMSDTIDYCRADVLNSNLFAGTSGPDSLPMCYDSHPNENDRTGTWDNLVSGTIAPETLQSMLNAGVNMTGPQGRPASWNIDTDNLEIWSHSNNDSALRELTQSPRQAWNNFNAVTVRIDKLTIKTSPLFTSTTMAFLVNKSRVGFERSLTEVFRTKPQLLDNSPADATVIVDKQIRAVFGMGFGVARDIIGLSG